ncbi:MFS transporter [Saprospiraceae bacterium]|nr:MFS transporter [Saprospiraceae bacterium]MDB4539832.1 MFS transporter [Saprospiraceae bacterium]MDC3219566.1 MFS transporter [Saprospiraceae bacterium]
MSDKKQTSTTPLDDKKIINGWAMFDWANSAYALVITAAIFPAYFNGVTNTYDPVTNDLISKNVTFLGITLKNSTLFSYSVSFGYLLIASVLPLLTGIADYAGRKMYFMKRFTTLGSLACLSLFFFTGPENLWLGVIGFILALIGFAGGQVFYNSYLPIIASEKNLDNVSAKGFSRGYIGSVILLIFNLTMITFHAELGLDKQMATRIAFLSVGLWWIGFAQISFNALPKDIPTPVTQGVMKKGYQELQKVFGILKTLPDTKRFLTAYFFYISGVMTVMMLATIFAEDELKMETSKLIITVLVIQLVAIAGAHLFAKLSSLKGNKFSLLVMLFIWIGICLAAYLTTDENQFFALAGVVGLVMGGIQSLSRSTYSKLLPKNTSDTASFFSFFDVLEKTGIVFGTFIFGFIGESFGLRYSVLFLIIYFLIGIGVLLTVKVKTPIEV